MRSIIVPAYNQHAMTQDCLSAVRAHTRDYEVILIDNGSTPPIDGASIRNETNRGFPVAVNQGIRLSRGDTIILLNNDVFVTDGWADRLEAALEHYAIVAPVTNYCAGAQQVTLPVYYDEQGLHREAGRWAEAHAGETQAVSYVIGFCMAFRRSLFDALGPFDESLWPCSGEEIDFCMRALVAGHRVGIARDVYLHHVGSQTFAAMERGGELTYTDLCKRNDAHLAKRWGPGLWQRQEAL